MPSLAGILGAGAVAKGIGQSLGLARAANPRSTALAPSRFQGELGQATQNLAASAPVSPGPGISRGMLSNAAVGGATSLEEIRSSYKTASAEFEQRLRSVLRERGVDIGDEVVLEADALGQINVVGYHPQKQAIESLFREIPDLRNQFVQLESQAELLLPLLITGISGVAGYNALPYFQRLYPGQVIGIRQTDNWRLAGPGIEVCDAEDIDRLRGLFEKYQFRSVLDCAGNCALKSCELDPAMAWRINVEGPRNLLEVIHDRDVRLVHLSIDLVFSGMNGGGHVERDPTDPVTVYGKTMAAAERLILAAEPRAAVLRISLPMGVSFNGHAGAIDWIQSRFKKHRPATLYFDEVRTPTYTDCLNEVCAAVLVSSLSGLYHAGGPRRLSLYQIAQVINRVGGYDPKLLRGSPRIEAGPIPPRAGNVSLDSTKLLQALGYDPFDPWPLNDDFVPTHHEWHHERNGEQGSPKLLAEVLYRNPRKVRLQLGAAAPALKMI